MLEFKGKFNLLRSVTAADNPLLLAATRDVAAPPSGSVVISAGEINELQIICAVDGSDNHVNVFNLYVGRNGRGPAIFIGEISFTAGLMEVGFDPDTGAVETALDFYAQSSAIVQDRHFILNNMRVSNEQANDQIASVVFDPGGCNWVFAEAKTIASTKCNLYYAGVSR